MTDIKTQGYDGFRCIADQCPMTCCQGWTIKVDEETYHKWINHADTAYLCGYVTTLEEIKPDEADGMRYEMKTDETRTCLLVDERGLCEVVKRHGDGYLCGTCALFPRKRNDISLPDENGKEQVVIAEYSLSGGCPAVMDLLWNMDGSLNLEMTSDGKSVIAFPAELRLRNMIICILQGDGIYGKLSLTERILTGFDLLHDCLEQDKEEATDKCIAMYGNPQTLDERLLKHRQYKHTVEEVMEELSLTFWNVTEYYKEEPMYHDYLYAPADKVGSWYPEVDTKKARAFRDAACRKWERHKKNFAQYDDYVQRVMASEIFADCVSDDLVALAESYQAIVLEYIMTRMMAFLTEEYTDENVKRYYALMIRIIGHNTQGMAEYWEENFEDSVWEPQYIHMLLQ